MGTLALPSLGQRKRIAVRLTGDTGPFYEVKRVINCTLDENGDIVQANDNSNMFNVQKLPGRSNNTAAVTCNYVNYDPGQNLIAEARRSGLLVDAKYMPIPTVGMALFTFTSYITHVSRPAQDNSPQTFEFTFEITGGIIGGIVGTPGDPVIVSDDLAGLEVG